MPQEKAQSALVENEMERLPELCRRSRSSCAGGKSGKETEMRKEVIVAGHICLDITPVFPPRTAGGIKEVLQPGKLIEMCPADVHTGGVVANTGLAMKLLGADVRLMGKVGNDPFGEMVLDILKKYGAQEGMLVAEDEATSYSVILAVPGVDRIFLHNPGTNNTFRADDIPDEALQNAALFHFGYPPLMQSMYRQEGDELLRLFRRAKKAGAATSLDMAAVDPASEAGQADWKRILERVLPYVDFFLPSVEELCFVLDRERFADLQSRAGGRDITEILDIDRDVKPLADQCMALGAKALLIKCGAPGLYYRTAGAEQMQSVGARVRLDAADWAEREGFEQSYKPERVLSGTGAGDTCIAAFLTAMLDGYPLGKCLQLAAAAGASCVAAYDALSGLRPLAELEEKIRSGWEKI